MIGPMTIEQAMAGIERLSTRFSVDEYSVVKSDSSKGGELELLEAWVHEIAHAVCLGMELKISRVIKKIDLSTRISLVMRANNLAQSPRFNDYQELITVGAEFAFLRHLGVCRSRDKFERKVAKDAASKLCVVDSRPSVHLMFWLACRPVSVRRAETIRQTLAQWR